MQLGTMFNYSVLARARMAVRVIKIAALRPCHKRVVTASRETLTWKMVMMMMTAKGTAAWILCRRTRRMLPARLLRRYVMPEA